MRKPSARIVVAALAIPLFGGFATYAAAQVSTQPSPQVVIPAVRPSTTTRPASTLKISSTSSALPGYDVNDDKGGLREPGGTDDPANHDANDDHGSDAVTASSVANTAATTPASTPSTVEDHGGDNGNRDPGGGSHDG